MTDSTAKKNTQKLQRAVVDGLEDVKAQNIVVFNTEHLSALFERVVVASGTSNRQTKALAASVRDAVREAGFPKPRVEGEENGEWIIVDCGQVVVHIMQPAIRQYYNLEEIWGDKPVHLKGPASRVQAAAAAKPDTKPAPRATAGRAKAVTRAESETKQAIPSAKRSSSAAKKVATAPASKKPAATPARVAAKKTAAPRTAAPTAPKVGAAPAKKASAATRRTPAAAKSAPGAESATGAKAAPAAGRKAPARKSASRTASKS